MLPNRDRLCGTAAKTWCELSSVARRDGAILLMESSASLRQQNSFCSKNYPT